jgi:hypothetical protein
MANAGYLTDKDVKDVIEATTAAGFDQKLKGRESFSESRPAVQQSSEDTIRRVIQDNAQYIVPVTWSNAHTIGLPLLPKWNAKEAMRMGLEAILNASAQEVDQYGEHPQKKSSPWAAKDAYLHSGVRATAQQQNGFLHQGYLAVGISGISLVGINLNWSPEFQYQQDPNRYFYLRTKEDHVRWQRRQLPPADVSYEFFEVASIPYENIQEIKTAELLRIDGLSAFVSIHSALSRKLEEAGKDGKALYKAYMKSPYQGPFRDLTFETSLKLPNLVVTCFQDIILDVVSFGIDQASGVPLHEGIPAQQLFSKSLAASIVDSRNGTYFGIESVFGELDIALALIEDLRTTASRQSSSKSTKESVKAEVPQFDIAAQLQKLAELHAAGALTEEEFREAKMKLLS